MCNKMTHELPLRQAGRRSGVADRVFEVVRPNDAQALGARLGVGHADRSTLAGAGRAEQVDPNARGRAKRAEIQPSPRPWLASSAFRLGQIRSESSRSTTWCQRAGMCWAGRKRRPEAGRRRISGRSTRCRAELVCRHEQAARSAADGFPTGPFPRWHRLPGRRTGRSGLLATAAGMHQVGGDRVLAPPVLQLWRV